MSGLSDLASWALRGVGGGGSSDENTEDAGNTMATSDLAPLSPEEVRAQRLARMQASSRHASEPEPMNVDTQGSKQAAASPKTTSPMDVDQPKEPKPAKADGSSTPSKKKTKTSKTTPVSSTDAAARKLQRKKEIMLKKVLSIVLEGGSMVEDSVSSKVDLQGSIEITVESTTDILANRLAKEGDAATTSNPAALSKIAYLAQCHRKASEEIKDLWRQEEQNQKSASSNDDLIPILEEIQKQVVSYAGSCLLVPGLFPNTDDSSLQLAKCLINGSSDVANAITSSVLGKASASFYAQLCEELINQDDDIFKSTITAIAQHVASILTIFNTVFEGNSDGNPLQLVGALSGLCSHKRAAQVVSEMPQFLLPKAGTPQALEQVQPRLPAGNQLLQMFGADPNFRPYRKRSGVGLEKNTLLGQVLSVGLPRVNSEFSQPNALRQSQDAVRRAHLSQRQQLRVYQEAAQTFIMNLIKNAEARNRVMQWFVDALTVNTGAAGLQPDPTKVSSSRLLLNMSMALLKLCDPFMDDPAKLPLIDAGFVSSSADHGGVFPTTGDDAVPRLGADLPDSVEYNPKNRFVPQCFFFCAQSLHLSIAPMLRLHENLLRHISHMHWTLQNENRDVQSEPQFGLLISRQRSMEAFLYQEELIKDTLRFLNLLAAVVNSMDASLLRTLPEDFVSDSCHIVMMIAKMEAKLLRGIEFRNIFRMAVKLLSPKFAGVSSLHLNKTA